MDPEFWAGTIAVNLGSSVVKKFNDQDSGQDWRFRISIRKFFPCHQVARRGRLFPLMRFRTVLFDLDGTLIDHFSAIHRCHAYAMRKLGLREPSYAEVRAAVGGGLDEAIARLAGRENVAAALPLFTEHWNATNLDDVTLLPGARELLADLNQAGARCGVLTNKRGNAARQVCTHLGLDPLLAAVFGANDTPWIKPDVRFLQHALVAMAGETSSAVLVGDSPWDLAAAQNAGIPFVGVTTGTHSAEELRAAGGTAIFPDLKSARSAL
jgi:phosphoglycolate phosphatase